jgi:hypothetical protein
MTPHADLLPRYKHLRQVALRLNDRLVETLPKSVLDEGGKKLGLLKKNVLALDTEDEMCVLMDYCIYDVRRDGANAVERFLAKHPPAPDSDERVLLEAMRQARYSLFAVEGAERGVGVHVRDLLRGEVLFLMDVSFSNTAPVGMVLATRIMAPDGITMTTGAALPVAVLPPEGQAQLLEGLAKGFKQADFRNLTPQEASELATAMIRACLREGAAEQIEYIEPGRGHRSGKPAPWRPARHLGRNDPCPCGSGRKFKNCCGARR